MLYELTYFQLTFSLENKYVYFVCKMLEFLGHSDLWKQVIIEDDVSESDPRLMIIHVYFLMSI